MNKIEKKFTITSTVFENGESTMERTNDGFQAFELLGLLDISASDIKDQINKKKSPDLFIRNLLIDVENPRNQVEQLLSNIYKLGWQAQEEGKSLFDCPYDQNNENPDIKAKHKFWEAGFLAAIGAKLKYPYAMKNEDFGSNGVGINLDFASPGNQYNSFYIMGMAAYKAGKEMKDNPYLLSDDDLEFQVAVREAWQAGWLAQEKIFLETGNSSMERREKEYREGAAAFGSGKNISDNPYGSHDHAGLQWKAGFLERYMPLPSLDSENPYIAEGKHAFEKNYSRGANPYISDETSKGSKFVQLWYIGYDDAESKKNHLRNNAIKEARIQQRNEQLLEGYRANLSLFIEKICIYDNETEPLKYNNWHTGWELANKNINTQKLDSKEYEEISKQGIRGYLEDVKNPYDMMEDVLRYAIWQKAAFKASKTMVSYANIAYDKGQEDAENGIKFNPFRDEKQAEMWEKGHKSMLITLNRIVADKSQESGD